MSDFFSLGFQQSIQAESDAWYQVQQPLGIGRNAITYLVLATSGEFQGHLFAIKVFRRLSMPQRAADLNREYDFLKTCNHPSVMRVLHRNRAPHRQWSPLPSW